MRISHIVLLLVCMPAIVFASDLVVLESNSPDYEAGEILDAESQIVLTAEGVLKLIAEDGTYISLEGPYVGPPTGDETGSVSGVLEALGRLVGSADISAADIGGVRGDAERDQFLAIAVNDSRTSLWLVHTDMTGPHCVRADAEEVQYWRENGNSSEALQVRNVASGRNVSMNWQAGEKTVSTGGASLLVAEQIYLLRRGDALRSTTVQVREIPAGVSDDDLALVAFLAAKGCIPQARMQLDRLRSAI